VGQSYVGQEVRYDGQGLNKPLLHALLFAPSEGMAERSYPPETPKEGGRRRGGGGWRLKADRG